MERELAKLRADEAEKGTSETHVLKAARAIYSVAFREVTRQVTVSCAERGALLSKIFAVHSDLLDGMIAERERWKLAEAAAWVTQQQAADATKLRAKVARMLLSTQQVLAAQQDDGLRSAADDDWKDSDLLAAAGGGIGGMSGLFAAKETLRPQDVGLSSPAEGSGQGGEQARLARTLELAAGLEGKGAETLLRTLMADDAGALPSVGTQARLLAADTLVSSLNTARRVTWLTAHAQRLPPDDENQLLVTLLRDMGVSRWASLLAEVRGSPLLSPTRRAAPTLDAHARQARASSHPRQHSRAKLASPLGPPTEAARSTRRPPPRLTPAHASPLLYLTASPAWPQVLVELPVQQLSPVLAPPLILMTQVRAHLPRRLAPPRAAPRRLTPPRAAPRRLSPPRAARHPARPPCLPSRASVPGRKRGSR